MCSHVLSIVQYLFYVDSFSSPQIVAISGSHFAGRRRPIERSQGGKNRTGCVLFLSHFAADIPHVQLAGKLELDLRQAGVSVTSDVDGDVGSRFIRQDETGTPYAILVDETTVRKGLTRFRSRDTTQSVGKISLTCRVFISGFF